jgi:DNA-binding CsgD family transcriptional regulator
LLVQLDAAPILPQFASLHLILGEYLPGRLGPIPIIAPRLLVREREVAQLAGGRKSARDIATLLGVTVKTAETHRTNLMLKANLHSTIELVLYAVRNEIIQLHLPGVIPSGPHTLNGHLHTA